ncbi:MAG: hypothetical protein H6925_05830 [Holosporaceae bacterium]|nr:MAG: hypothetical protein H6925_05830 [Holosporaceae bacterium]
MDIKEKPNIVLIAGEPSGDILGASLMRALKSKAPDATFHGVGGALMGKEGLNSFYGIEELSVMGFAEAVGRLWAIRKRLKETLSKIEELRPDVVITIDFPGFNFCLEKSLKKT